MLNVPSFNILIENQLMRQKTSLCGAPPTCALSDQKGFSSIVSEAIELLSGARSKRQKTTIMKLLAAVPPRYFPGAN